MEDYILKEIRKITMLLEALNSGFQKKQIFISKEKTSNGHTRKFVLL